MPALPAVNATAAVNLNTSRVVHQVDCLEMQQECIQPRVVEHDVQLARLSCELAEPCEGVAIKVYVNALTEETEEA